MSLRVRGGGGRCVCVWGGGSYTTFWETDRLPMAHLVTLYLYIVYYVTRHRNNVQINRLVVDAVSLNWSVFFDNTPVVMNVKYDAYNKVLKSLDWNKFSETREKFRSSRLPNKYYLFLMSCVLLLPKKTNFLFIVLYSWFAKQTFQDETP